MADGTGGLRFLRGVVFFIVNDTISELMKGE